MNRLFRALNWAMVPLFLLAVVVQWNDPDPGQWMVIYGAAFGVCLIVALRRPLPLAAPVIVGMVALIWSLAIAWEPAADMYLHMFDAWEMQSASVEQAREATGLLIVAGWMLAIAMRQRRGFGGV